MKCTTLPKVKRDTHYRDQWRKTTKDQSLSAYRGDFQRQGVTIPIHKRGEITDTKSFDVKPKSPNTLQVHFGRTVGVIFSQVRETKRDPESLDLCSKLQIVRLQRIFHSTRGSSGERQNKKDLLGSSVYFRRPCRLPMDSDSLQQCYTFKKWIVICLGVRVVSV